MTEREMLELAAKAAGIEIVPCTCHYEQWPFKYAEGQGKRGHWNPLHDDGDALRLATKLQMEIDHNHPADHTFWVAARPRGRRHDEVEEFEGESQRGISIRRAIVRAAAEIGRALP